ncbi:MAG: AAA family ATPase [Hyphomonadaceae bacterium]|nr:AAA family ATPase [Hyphomonadaceae bacterium]
MRPADKVIDVSGAGPQLPPPVVPDPICAHAFLAMQFPPRDLLLAPWLPEKGLAMIAAPRGLGKTHVALNVAFAVASGGSFLRWRASAARRVLYVDGEMPAVSLQERLARIVAHSTADLAPDVLAFLAADQCEFGLPDLSTPEGQALLRPRLDPFDLIVLDNLSTLCRSGRENEAESWGQVQAFALELRRANKSVLFVHHTGKGGAQRGTSKREDVLDSVLLLKRPEDYGASQGARFIVQFDKARGFTGADAEPFEAALDPHTGLWSMTAVSESRDAQIRELKGIGYSVREIAEELGVSKSTVDRVLQRLNGGANGHAV